MKSSPVFGYLNNEPPPPSDTRQDRIALVSSIGPADAFIASWLKFHALAGIRDFYLYDNGAPDAALQQAVSLAQKEGWKLDIFPWNFIASTDSIKKDTLMQIDGLLLAYCHAIANHGNNYRWFAFIDSSDLIVPKQQDTLAPILQGLATFSNISLPRVDYPSTNADAKSPLEATHKLPAAAPDAITYRCLVDPCKVIRLYHGSFITSDMKKKTANDQGRVGRNSGLFSYRRGWSRFYSTEHIQLNHYSQAQAPGSQEDGCALDFLKRHGYSSVQEFIASCS